MLRHDLLSGHLWVLQLFEELVQTVCFPTLSPLPQLIWHQGCQAACEHLTLESKIWRKFNLRKQTIVKPVVEYERMGRTGA